MDEIYAFSRASRAQRSALAPLAIQATNWRQFKLRHPKHWAASAAAAQRQECATNGLSRPNSLAHSHSHKARVFARFRLARRSHFNSMQQQHESETSSHSGRRTEWRGSGIMTNSNIFSRMSLSWRPKLVRHRAGRPTRWSSSSTGFGHALDGILWRHWARPNGPKARRAQEAIWANRKVGCAASLSIGFCLLAVCLLVRFLWLECRPADVSSARAAQ